MAETLRIRIPVEIQDRTSAGIRSSQRSITAFEKALNRMEESLRRLDRDHEVGLSVRDNATNRIRGAEDALNGFAGSSGSAEIGANDHASQVVAAARDLVEAYGGLSGTADIGANDTASSVIDSVMDKAAAWAGTAWNATVGIVDTVTAPLSKVGNALKNPIVAGAGAMGISFGATDALNTYKDFEAQMSEVAAISGATGSELDELTEKAKYMGATTKFTATEAGEAFSYMAMAGWKSGQMVDGIEGIMNLAAASGENLGTVSDIVTDALTAFGLQAADAGHFADVLAQASSNANTNVSMLGESFKYVAPVAGAMGYAAEDVSLALGLMANASVKGSMAGTALKTSLANMASPSDKMANYMDRYGISLTDADGRMLSLLEVIDMLRSKMGGLSETEQTAAASAIFGKEAMAGMLAIINASEGDYDKLRDAIYDADGAAQRMSETMMDNLQGSLTLMGSAIDGLKTSFGERLAPYVKGIAEGITDAIPGITSAVSGIMDNVDHAFSGIKSNWKLMVASDDFQKADLLGKVNIAWNKIVAEPFVKWAGTKGKHLLSGALGGLLEEASKIFPGGEDAGIMSWLSAGVIAKGVTTAVSGIGKLAAAAGAINPVFGLATGAAAGLAAGIGAINLAIDAYNQKKINESLSAHFGDISLSEEETEKLASKVLDISWDAEITIANAEFKNAEEFHNQAETALNNNDKLLFLGRVSARLQASKGEDYITPFIADVQKALDEYVPEDEDALRLVRAVSLDLSIDPESSQAVKGVLVAEAQAIIEEINKNATPEELDAYRHGVNVELTPEQQENYLQKVEDEINRQIQEKAEAEGIPYTQSMHISLSPDDKTDILGDLSAYVEGELQKGLDPDPAYNGPLDVVLTPEMQEDYAENIKTFIKSKEEEMEALPFAAKVSISAVLGDTAGAGLQSAVEAWAAGDMEELSGLSDTLTQAMQEALEDGVLSVEEQAVIEVIQTKMKNIVSGWQAAEAEAEWQALQMKFSGADLDADSFTRLIEAVQRQRESSFSALDNNTVSMLAMFNSWETSGKIDDGQHAALSELWKNNVFNQQGTAIARGLDFEVNTLSETYGSALDANRSKIASKTAEFWQTVNEGWEVGTTEGRWHFLAQDVATGVNSFLGDGKGLEDGDFKALKEKYEAMESDVAAMQTLIDRFRNERMAVPQAIMDSYNEAIMVGAAAGSEDAAWQAYANELVASGNEELLNALTNPDGKLYESVPDALREALERSMQETTADFDIEGLINGIIGSAAEEAELDLGVLQELFGKYGLDISDYLAENGIEADAEGAKIYLKDFIPSGATIDVPSLDAAAEEVKTEAEESLGAAVSEADVETPAQDFTDNVGQAIEEADKASVEEGVEGLADGIETDIAEESAGIDTATPMQQVVDDAGASLADADRAPIHQSVLDLYIDTRTDVQETFSTPIDATCPVNVEFEYNYVNPLSGMTYNGGTGGAAGKFGPKYTLSAYADGGLVTEPSIAGEAGPEMVIPLTGNHGRSMELLAQAGQMLGAWDGSGQSSGETFSTDAFSGQSPKSGGNSTPVTVTMAPVFQIDGAGGDEGKIVEAIRNSMDEITNHVANEIGRLVDATMGNMPTEV